MSNPATFDERCAWLKSNAVGMKQSLGELRTAWDCLSALRPKSFMEIGSLCGGSLYAYAGACAPAARIVALDWPRDRDFENTLLRVIQALRTEGYEAEYVRGKSHDKATVSFVLNHAIDIRTDGYRWLGALHIDGEHGEVVRWDWEHYGSMVVPGGLVLFHDIAGAPSVKKLWGEIKASGLRTEEFIGEPEPGRTDGVLSGIGAVWMA